MTKMKNAACMGQESLLQTTIGTHQMPKVLWVANFDHKIKGAPGRPVDRNIFDFASGFFEGKPRRKRHEQEPRQWN